ncbi:methyltransferase domain-containing protein [Mariniblastus fucicola]|uniref:Mg-protoporphyrin IX methyl transferase n=1 Tax=Mariniblastus fucicola TaxID=980251 RepID=A0A5B9PGK2_9BACT|nr:methyltransferase domain-containing protein [Mariniblastus fucicola]QEG23726.1 Mg-protoporphyrin IX methyl transferase [Mariniblastus fucicola]
MNDDATFWNACYRDGKTGWDRGSVHPALDHWMDSGQLQPCSIIVPGCGRGHEVVKLAQEGFNVTAIDLASEPVKNLRKRLVGFEENSRVVQGSMFDFQPPQKVDAVYEQTCLCAIGPESRLQYEQAVFQWLKPDGKLFALFAQVEGPNGPPFHCGLEDMKLTFPDSRWDWPNEEPVRFEHPSGKLVELAYVLFRKRETDVG